MGRRKSFGNPFSKALGEVLDKVAPEFLDSTIDVLTGPGKSKRSTTSSTSRSTDWHTRVETAPRKRS